MKLLHSRALGVLIAALAPASSSDDSSSSDDVNCFSVSGTLVSSVVGTFSDGSECDSPLGLCTEGLFEGGLSGHFRFVALQAFPDTFKDAPAEVRGIAPSTGQLLFVDPNVCDGSITVFDTTMFTLVTQDRFASLQTIVGATGDCEGVSGRLRSFGVFEGGCVDCVYEGEICFDG